MGRVGATKALSCSGNTSMNSNSSAKDKFFIRKWTGIPMYYALTDHPHERSYSSGDRRGKNRLVTWGLSVSDIFSRFNTSLNSSWEQVLRLLVIKPNIWTRCWHHTPQWRNFSLNWLDVLVTSETCKLITHRTQYLPVSQGNWDLGSRLRATFCVPVCSNYCRCWRVSPVLP